MPVFQLPENLQNFDQFPDDFLLHIFEYIKSLNDLLNIRQVNSRWMRIIDRLNLTGGLAVILKTTIIEVFHQKPKCFSGNYIFTNENINYDYLFQVQSPSSLSSVFNANRFLVERLITNLNRMCFNCIVIENLSDLRRFESFINRFPMLEQLQFDYLIMRLRSPSNDDIEIENVTFNLDRIKIFTVIRYLGGRLNLDAPLVKLAWHSDFSQIEITNKLDITHLQLNTFDGRLADYVAANYIHFRNLNADVVSGTRSVHVMIDCFRNALEINFDDIDRGLAIELFRQLRIRRLLNLTLYIADIRITNVDQIEQIYGPNNFQLPNMNLNKVVNLYNDLSPIVTCVTEIDYCTLPTNVTFDAPFFERFINIRRIVFDKGYFIWREATNLIKNCKALEALLFKESISIHPCYSDLPSYAPFLSEFEINLHRDYGHGFDFVMGFKYLQILQIKGREISFEKFSEITTSLEFLNVFRFEKNKQIQINIEEQFYKIDNELYILSIEYLNLNDPTLDDERRGGFKKGLLRFYLEDLFRNNFEKESEHFEKMNTEP